MPSLIRNVPRDYYCRPRTTALNNAYFRIPSKFPLPLSPSLFLLSLFIRNRRVFLPQICWDIKNLLEFRERAVCIFPEAKDGALN